MKSHNRFLVPIALVLAFVQIGVLGSMIVGRAAILRDGREVTLRVLPVDPRDLLRGDYVRLGYDISSLPISLFGASPGGPPQDGTLYVRLAKGDDGVWEAVAAGFGAPPQGAAAADTVDMRGTTYIHDLQNVNFVPAEYGIERFYLPEGEGRPIEEGIREGRFTMVVAVDDAGAAQIKAFYDGDTLIYREPAY